MLAALTDLSCMINYNVVQKVCGVASFFIFEEDGFGVIYFAFEMPIKTINIERTSV